MVDEKLITKEEALRRVEPEALNQLLQPIFVPAAKKAAIDEGRLLAKGLTAGPGAATGKIVFFADEAEALAAKGETNVILCRHETSPEDIRGMNASDGILTAFGGMTSHAALVAGRWARSASSAATRCRSTTTRARCASTASDQVLQGRRLHLASTASPARSSPAQIATKPSEVMQVLIDKTLDAGAVAGLSAATPS